MRTPMHGLRLPLGVCDGTPALCIHYKSSGLNTYMLVFELSLVVSEKIYKYTFKVCPKPYSNHKACSWNQGDKRESPSRFSGRSILGGSGLLLMAFRALALRLQAFRGLQGLISGFRVQCFVARGHTARRQPSQRAEDLNTCAATSEKASAEIQTRSHSYIPKMLEVPRKDPLLSSLPYAALRKRVLCKGTT